MKFLILPVERHADPITIIADEYESTTASWIFRTKGKIIAIVANQFVGMLVFEPNESLLNYMGLPVVVGDEDPPIYIGSTS
jgi:hypothetical protein